jgi:lysophospholipase L1-like esterase
MKKLGCWLFLIIAPMAWAQTNNNIAPNNSLIQYSGRIDFSNPQAPRFDWPGVSITAAFHGTSIGFLLEDKDNNYDVMLDGKPVTLWVTSPNQPLYTLDNLTAGDHWVKVIKRTESLFGLATFKGLVLASGSSLSKAPDLPNRRIEIIGDSVLCGYGVESSDVHCDSLRPYENADKAFGALIAKDLQAEYHIEAFSGKGVVRNWGDKQTQSADPYPPLFDRTICRDEKSVWDFNQWVPNAVIIHLGLNDFSSSPQADPKEFTHAYIAFLKHIREKYPKAFIFCVAPLGWPSVSPILDKIVEKRNSAGDKNIQLLTYPPVVPDEFGCDGHPNAVAQRKIADAIIPAIKQTLYW